MQRLPAYIILVAGVLSSQPVLAGDEFLTRYPDFACDIDKGPLSDEEKAKIDNAALMKLGATPDGQEQIDRIYARSTAGAMPAGFYSGKIIPAKSEQQEFTKKYLTALGLPAEIANDGTLKFLGEALWKGKIFKNDPLSVSNAPSRILANKMPAVSLQGFFAVLNMAPPDFAGANEWRFPAKVFCGISLFDARRESVVIDYAHTETVVDDDANAATKINYLASIDQLAGREYLAIRDEIRMVKPGFYLGRAYMGRLFVLNFTLECLEGDCRKEAAEDCDVGSQRRGGNNTACMSIPDFRNLNQ